jgi:hypothetical protein
VRSAASRRWITGKVTIRRPAATSQRSRQSTRSSNAAKPRGKIDCPTAKPSPEIDSASPRRATNQRAMATMASWLIIPCPRNLRRRMITASPATLVFMLIATQTSARPGITTAASARTRNRSVSAPAQSMIVAETMVESV